MKIAVLCYHSWNIHVDWVAEDIRTLRKKGWTALHLRDLLALRSNGRLSSDQFFHVTNDDAAPSDGLFSERLREMNCPATFFVPTGNLSADRVDFYRKLDQGGLIAIEDHSLFHRKMFLGPRLIEFYSSQAKSTGLEHLGLRAGMPILEFGGELSGPLYEVDPKVIDFCLEHAGVLTERHLILARLAREEGGEIRVLGEYESSIQYRKRVEDYIYAGAENFKKVFGRNPVAFCYPFFQGSEYLRGVLRNTGYKLQFGGRGRFWDGKTDYVPRIPIDEGMPRPLDPYALCRISFATRVRSLAGSVWRGLLGDTRR